MKSKLSLLFSVGICIACHVVAQAREIVIFDSEKSPAASIANRTAHWIKDSDIMPITSDETRDGGRWIKFQYNGGKKGIGISQIVSIPPDTFNNLQGEDVRGLKFKIAYGEETPKPILGLISFEGGAELHCRVFLKKDQTEYTVNEGHCKKTYDWNKIRSVNIWMKPDYFVNNETPVFYLREISLMTTPTKYKKERKVTIIQKRKAQEIVALTGTDGAPDELIKTIKSHGQKLDFDVNGGAACPVAAFGGFDAMNLYILWEAAFADTPIAGITEKDQDVYLDEAIELFFNGTNDNNNFIQFVVNAKGTVFDYYREFDTAACGMINNIKKDVPHKKHISYNNNTLTYLFTFPLSGLNINYPKFNLFGFQAVQNYKKEKRFENKKLSTTIWSSTSRNPDPFNFGALVLNQKKAETFSVDITSIAAKDIDAAGSGNLSDFIVAYSIKGLAPGEYKVRAELADAEYGKFTQEGTVVISHDGGSYTLAIPRVKNNIGVYTVYLSVFDKNNDSIVAGVNFLNTVEVTSLFGTKFIYPTPKEVVWQDGVFKADMPGNIAINGAATDRTKKTAAIFQDMLHGYVGQRYGINNDIGTDKNQIRLSIEKSTVFNGKTIELKPEGYHLKVSPNAVSITAADEAGLFYGCNTFIKLIKMPMKVQKDTPVQCVEILDWPDYRNRALRIEPSLNWGGGDAFHGGDATDSKFFIGLFQKLAVNNNYNYIIWDFSPMVKFKLPEMQGPERVLTMEDIRTVTEYCCDRFIGIIPKVQIGGHASWWMTGFEKFRLKGYGSNADTTLPEHDRVLYACLDEIMDATHAKYLFTGDEWWFERVTTEEVKPYDASKPLAQIFFECYDKLNKYLNAKGARLMLFEDMLTPDLSGLKNDNYKNCDKLSKNIIIAPWAGGATSDKIASYFLEKGFDVWGSATYHWRYKDMSVRKRITGYGPSLYSYGVAYGGFKNSWAYPQYCSVLYGAEFAWNGQHTDDASIPEEICSGKLTEAAYLNTVRPNAFASEGISPISLKVKANCNFDQFLGGSLGKYGSLALPKEKNIGNVEMDLLPGAVNCIRISGDAPATTIEVGRNCSSLIFLHSAFQRPNASADILKKYKRMLVLYPRWPNGFPCGDYEVEYEDGTSTKAPIRLFNNVYWMNSDPVSALITLNNRYVLMKKTSGGQELFLYQWEWVNPYPQKKIISITCSNKYEFEFDVFLFALSGREVKTKLQHN
ncbi:MAG: glycoside hydrolase family 20 zincin-like fold domain-containing protein [Victivallales bacterium]